MFKSTSILKAVIFVLGFFAFVPALYAEGRFTVSADGQEVKDNQTLLIWKRCPEGMTWSVNLCQGTAIFWVHNDALYYGSSGAWRLPNIKELASIVDRDHIDPAINSLVFPNTQPLGFWSSTPVDIDLAWQVDFHDGSIGQMTRNQGLMVRLVRGGK